MPHTTGHGDPGPGPGEDDTRFVPVLSRSQGLLALGFGFALGISSMILFTLIRLIMPSVASAFAGVPLWQVFLFGFISGTLIAAIYNYLTVRRLNLFGLEEHSGVTDYR